MTEQENNMIAGAMMVFAAATERLMREVLRIERKNLSHEGKEMWNGMQRGVRQARFYYERFTDAIATVLYEDKATEQIDLMRLEGDEMIRLYLRIVNAMQNGHYPDHIENSIGKLAEDKQVISEEVINQFKMITCDTQK